MNKLIIVLATLGHLLPHPFGVSPVGAMALYAGAYGRKRWSWLVPCMALLLGNAIFGFYEPLVLVFVYAGFALSTLAGRWLLSGSRSYPRYAAAVVSGAGIFFIVSNFSVWLAGMYPPTAAGLLQCYLNGLPYLGQAMIIDGIYCAAMFGLHTYLERRSAAAAGGVVAA